MNREQVKKLRKGQKLIFFERGMSGGMNDINGAHVVFFQVMITEIKSMPRDAVPGTIILRVVKAEKYLYNEKMGMIVNAPFAMVTEPSTVFSNPFCLRWKRDFRPT